MKPNFVRNWRIWIGLLLTSGVATLAFLAGGVADMKSYWPFGGRYPVLEKMASRVTDRLERELEKYSKALVLTGLHELVVESYVLPTGAPDKGAFLALSNTDFLVAYGQGNLYHVVIGGGTTRVHLLGSLGVAKNMPSNAGVKDLLLVAPGKLLATMTTHDAAKDCFALGLFEYSFDTEQRSLKQTRRVFQSEPCLTMPLALEEAGGRIVRFSEDSVLLSVGNLAPTSLVGDYGRVLKIRLRDGASSVFATGLRNQQGLFFDQERDLVLETEHGPRGGDEINVLHEGKDYGWPHVTYGTNYTVFDDESVDGTCVTKCGSHTGHELPLLAFTPSIGISNLVRYPLDGAEFHRWRGNLLVGSLRAGTLFRLDYAEGRIILSEPIPLGERLRDIALLPNGSISLMTDTGKLLILTRAKPMAQQ